MKIQKPFTFKTDPKLVIDSLEKVLTNKDLGFLQCPNQQENVSTSSSWTNRLKENGIQQLIVIGMGGSYLGAKAIQRALLGTTDKVLYLSSSDPLSFKENTEQIKDISKTHFLAISKSGETVETLLLMNYCIDLLTARGLDWKQHFSVLTEENQSTLYQFAEQNQLSIFPHDKKVGGRFSVLSLVGLMPLSFCGIDTASLLKGARTALADKIHLTEYCAEILASYKRNENITVFWPYYDRLDTWCDWLIQLWSESLGKSKKANGEPVDFFHSTPMYCIGARDQHSVLQEIFDTKNKFVNFIQIGSCSDETKPNSVVPGVDFSLSKLLHTQYVGTSASLSQNKVSNLSLEWNRMDEETMGYLCMFFELAVATLGLCSSINPFDQPGVELGKKITKQELGL